MCGMTVGDGARWPILVLCVVVGGGPGARRRGGPRIIWGGITRRARWDEAQACTVACVAESQMGGERLVVMLRAGAPLEAARSAGFFGVLALRTSQRPKPVLYLGRLGCGVEMIAVSCGFPRYRGVHTGRRSHLAITTQAVMCKLMEPIGFMLVNLKLALVSKTRQR